MSESGTSSRREVTAGALEGLRVLDVSWGPVAAIASMILADHGADVIRVDRPGGDPLRRLGAQATWDRSKRSAVFDLTDAADVEHVRRLAESADVIIDGLGVDGLERFDLGETTVRAVNNGVVWCAVSASDVERDEPALAHDILASAVLGVMADTGAHRNGPVFIGHPGVTYATAFLAVIGILAATHARLSHGKGDRVDVSQLDGFLALSTMEWWSEVGISFIRDKRRDGRLDFGRRRLLLQHYRCADGGILQINTVAPGAFGRAMQVFGVASSISPAPPQSELDTELTDDDLVTLRTVLPQVVSQQPLEHWTRELWAHNVACLPILGPGEVFTDEQVVHAGLMCEVEHPQLGPVSVVGSPIVLSRTPAPPPGRIDAIGGSDTEVRQSGWRGSGWRDGGATRSGAEGAAARHRPAPLAGVRILELSTYFAGPYANRLLGQLGAEVVKLEPLAGDPGRPLPDPCENAHGGKRSIAVDLKAPGCAELIARLVRSSDVMQHNMRPGAIERLGLGEDAVRAMRSDIVYSYATGYGSSGPKSRLQSFAPLHSGLAGLMLMAAGEGNDPVVPFGNEDYYSGMLGAVGTLLALVHRDRTGEGQRVEVSQLMSTVFATSEYYLRDGEICSTIPQLDSNQSGWSPGVRNYDCAVGTLCVSAIGEEPLGALRRLVVPAADAPDDTSLAAALEVAFRAESAETWVRRLRAVDVPCAVVRERPWLAEYLADAATVARGRAVAMTHREHGRVHVIGDLVRLRDAQHVPRTPAPALGEHTIEILRELGLDDVTAAALVTSGGVYSRVG